MTFVGVIKSMFGEEYKEILIEAKEEYDRARSNEINEIHCGKNAYMKPNSEPYDVLEWSLRKCKNKNIDFLTRQT